MAVTIQTEQIYTDQQVKGILVRRSPNTDRQVTC